MTKRGRPTKFTKTLANAICRRISDGQSLRTICDLKTMPSRASVHKWLNENKEFSDQYTRARAFQADLYADEIIEIADDSGVDAFMDDNGNIQIRGDAINRARLRVDARKWKAARMSPKKWGDKQLVDLTSSDGSMSAQPTTIELVSPSESSG